MKKKAAFIPPSVKPRSSERRAGFTFIELLVALTIFSILATSIYHTINAGVKLWSGGNSIIQRNEKLRIFFDTISQDLKNAALIKDVIECRGTAKTLAIPALINVFEPSISYGYAELARVVYSFENGKLIRRCAALKEGFNEEFAPQETLLEDLDEFAIEDFNFEYSYKVAGFIDEYDWKDKWEFTDNKQHIPRGVKIKLKLKNKITKNTEEYEKRVFIPIGELGE